MEVLKPGFGNKNILGNQGIWPKTAGEPARFGGTIGSRSRKVEIVDLDGITGSNWNLETELN
jgi:hypothetical protein